jgi:nucleoside-diphosphate-sugar epimerase
MKALVTGATGFVGSHLAEALQAQGHAVTALVRSPAKAGLLERWGIRLVVGGLSDRSALARAVADQDVVIHAAGLVAARNEAEFLAGNRDGTAGLVEAALDSGGRPRFLLISSLAAAGPSSPTRPLDGTETPRPVTQYGRSKLAAEEIVRCSGLPWTIIRPPIVYGPRDRELLKLFRIARLGFAPVFGEGQQLLSAVFAPDLAQAVIAVAQAPATTNSVYYASHPEVRTDGELVQAVGRALRPGEQGGEVPVRLVRVPRPMGRLLLSVTGFAARLGGQATILSRDKANEFFQPAWTADPSPLQAATGWLARHDLAAGLTVTAAWYRAEGWL